MMTTPMLNMPMIEVLRVWTELVEAYHGVNGYGGDTAELYAYRFCRDDPTRRLDKVDGEKCQLRKDAERRAGNEARGALWSLLTLFQQVMSAEVYVDGKTLYQWQQASEPFDHRVHVKVLKKE
jgi:hypothetical protein